MSKFIIDIDELNALYKKVKRSGSGEFTDFNVIKNNIENGLNLDSRVKAKLSNTGFIKDTIISLEASNTNLVDSLGKAISAFSPLSSIKSDIKIEEYISTMSFVNPLTMQDMLPFDITNLDELRKTIAEYSNAKASFTDQNSYYTIPNGDLLKNILNDNNWFIDSIDNDGNAIISGTYIIQVIKLIKEKISTLDNIRDGFNNIYLSGDRYTIDNFMAMCPPSSIFGDYTRDSITVDENGYVDLSLVFEQMGLLEKLSNLENVAEPLLAIEKQYESVKTQQTMLEQMVYGMSIAERLKPYEEVINNEDFLLNIESSDSCYYDEEEGVFILTGKARDLFLYWVNINPESYLNDDGNIEIDPLDMEGLIKHLNVAYVEPFENTGRVLEAGAIELLNILKINEIMPYLTETQKNIFWYHHNIDGIEKAGEYIDALKDYINSEIGKERAYNRVLRFSKDGKVDFPETLELLFKGLKDGTANLLDGALELFYSDGVKSIDQYEQMHLLQILMGDQYTIDNLMKLSTDPSSTEKEIEEFSKFCAVSANLGEGLWRDLAPHSYQIGSTVGYMALPVLLNLALPGTGSALLFAGSMGNAVEQHHQNYGELTWKAYLYGAMTAAAEVVMEKFGGLPGFTPQKIGFFRSLMQEGMQEFFQTFVNGAIDSAHFNTEYDFSTLGPEAIKSLIYGIITAGVFSGPGALKNITIKFMDGYTYTGNIIGALSYMVNNTEVTNYIEEKCLNQVNMDSIDGLSLADAQNRAYNFLFNLGQTNPDLLVYALNLQNGQKLNRSDYKQAVLDVQNFFNNNSLEAFIDIYEKGVETGNRFAFFRGYEEHNFIHVFRVAVETVNVAEKVYKLAEVLKSRGIDLAIAEINPQSLFLAGLSHDMGMKIENSIYYNQIENRFEIIEDAKYKIKEKDGKLVKEEFKDETDREDYLGDLTRKNHSLNSAIEIAKHSEIYGADTELVVCLAFLHSKSNSGVRNDVSSTEELSIMIDTLYRYSQQEGVEFDFDFTKIVSSIEETLDGNYVYTFVPEIINQLSLGSIALRAGDAHALKTGNNHSGNTIYVDPNSVTAFDEAKYNAIVFEINSRLETLRREKRYTNKDGTPWTDNLIIHDQLCLYEGSHANVSIESEQGMTDLGSTANNIFSKRIILGESNVGQPVVGVDIESGRLTYTIEVHDSVAPASTWTHGIEEKFGEYASFKFVPQSVIIELPADSSLGLIEFYEDQAKLANDKYKKDGSWLILEVRVKEK